MVHEPCAEIYGGLEFEFLLNANQLASADAGLPNETFGLTVYLIALATDPQIYRSIALSSWEAMLCTFVDDLRDV